MEVDKIKHQGKYQLKGNKKENCYKCSKPEHWAKEYYQNKSNKVIEVNKIKPRNKYNKRRKNKFSKRNNKRPFGRKGTYIKSEDIDDE